MKKTLVIGLLATAVVSTSCLAPVNTFAESKTTYLQQTSSTNAYNLDKFSNSIRALGLQMPVIKRYGLFILKQPNTISGITYDQSIARNNVNEWLDVYSPKLLEVNQDMQGFGRTFTDSYDVFVDLAGKMNEDSEAKEEFVINFNKLQDQVQAHELAMKDTLKKLNNYTIKLDKDSEKFSNKVSTAIAGYEGSNGDIKQLRADIGKLDEEIQDEILKILNLPKENLQDSLEIGKTVFKIGAKGASDKTVDVSDLEVIIKTGGKVFNNKVLELNNNILQKQQQKKQLLQKLAEIEIQVTQMTLIDQELNNFTRIVKKQSQDFDDLVSSWEMFNKTMIQTKTSLNTDSKIDSNALQAQLQELKKFTDELNKQTKEYEYNVTNIKVTE